MMNGAVGGRKRRRDSVTVPLNETAIADVRQTMKLRCLRLDGVTWFVVSANIRHNNKNNNNNNDKMWQHVHKCNPVRLPAKLDEQKMFIFNNIPQIIICRRLMHSDEWASLLP